MRYMVKYWNGETDMRYANNARDLAASLYGEEHIDRYSVDPELLDLPDSFEVLNAFYDRVCEITPVPYQTGEESPNTFVPAEFSVPARDWDNDPEANRLDAQNEQAARFAEYFPGITY